MEDPLSILLIEDDQKAASIILKALKTRGYGAFWANSVEQGVREAAFGADLVLLDLGLPDGEGYSVIQAVRKRFSIPIIVISGRDQEAEKVRSLDMGADDYLEKPFGMEELFARIRAVLRRSGTAVAPRTGLLRFSSLSLQCETGEVSFGNKNLFPTPMESLILELLMAADGVVVQRRELLEVVWEKAWPGQERSLKVHVSNLRKKLKNLTDGTVAIESLPGKGYKLSVAGEFPETPSRNSTP